MQSLSLSEAQVTYPAAGPVPQDANILKTAIGPSSTPGQAHSYSLSGSSSSLASQSSCLQVTCNSHNNITKEKFQLHPHFSDAQNKALLY